MKNRIYFILLGGFIMFIPTASARAEKPLYDIVITNASVYDGVSVLEKHMDVALTGDTIRAVGKIAPHQARIVIDAKGLVLAPGFIDAHTHSDFNPLIYPGLSNKILQGVTTEITGNCGMSAAPVLGAQADEEQKVWAREGVSIPAKLAWGDFKAYAEALQKAGLVTNHAALIGHGNLRGSVMGFAARKPTRGEMRAMKKILEDSLEQGAAGLSFGLVYLPGIYADSEEIAELCAVVKKHDGVCAFHIRSEGDHLVESIQEALDAGKATGVKIQLSHLKAGGKKNWSKIDDVFKLIESYRSQGVRVAADMYPYTAGYAELAGVLPPFYYEMQERLAFFKDPSNYPEIESRIHDYYKGQPEKWKEVAVGAIAGGKFPKYEGRTLQAIADKTKRSPEKVLIELLAATDFEVSAFYFSQSAEVAEKVLLAPYTAVGSDSIADGSTYPHPRAYGTFPRIFSQYVRGDRKLLPGRAIRKMTSEPARQFGLKDRGEIRAGYKADLVLFDLAAIQEHSDYAHPRLACEGVRWVFVNGVPAVKDGKFQDRRAGLLLTE
ncbi:MAG: D-aminoacylase, partial [Candidatus Omnitrophica bacterium]|nr:D-aminoacylase [Candidatus Omnitrophota bacterium]